MLFPFPVPFVLHQIRNMASVFTAEQIAILSCLSHIAHSPSNHRYLLLSDSLASLYSLQDSSSSNPLIQRILLIFHSLNIVDCQVTSVWIPGHINLPEHDAVDSAAKHATSLPKITDNSPLPYDDFKNHYRHLILCKWNLLYGKVKQTTNFLQ